MLLNKDKKRHGELHINLSEDFKELADIIKDSYEKFKRTYIFTDYNNKNKPISIHGLYKRMINLYSFTGQHVGVNILRSSYLTYQAEQKRLTVKDKKKLATLMRTRKDKIDDNYIKILPQKEKQEILNEMSEPKINLKPKISPYERQLNNNKSYYQKNKEDIIKRVKEYNQQIPKEEVNRKRILYYLNGDETYRNKIKQSTIDKYNIQYMKGAWI